MVQNILRVQLVASLLLAGSIVRAQPVDTSCWIESYLIEAKLLEGDGQLAAAQNKLDSARAIAVEANQVAELVQIIIRDGLLMQLRGNYDAAIGKQYEALRLAESCGDVLRVGEIHNNIGSIHHYERNYELARDHYEKSLAIRQDIGADRELALSYNNFGALYEDMGLLDKALVEHRKCLDIWNDLQDTGWIAVAYLNIGSCYKEMNQLDTAKVLYLQALELASSQTSFYMLSNLMTKIGRIHLLKNEPAEGLRWCMRAKEIAEDWDVMPLLKSSSLCMYEAYDQLGRPPDALSSYKEYIGYRDSLFGQDRIKEITRVQMDYQFEKKALADSLLRVKADIQKQFAFDQSLAKERERRNLFLYAGIAVLILAAGLWSRLNFVRRSRTRIQQERDRSDSLLLNILPASVARELKEKGEATAKEFSNVSIVFTDFTDFTAISATLGAQELVAEINECFVAFDRIIEKYGIEKIKTIGDAYMAVGGLPDPKVGKPYDVILAALEMQKFMRERRKLRVAEGLPAFDMRAGIHSGPVVAGIVGKKKFQYDIWGDSVNTASRIESSGEAGKVNISATTYDQVKGESDLEFIPRGLIEVKGKGKIEMYFVSLRKSIVENQGGSPSVTDRNRAV